MKHVEIEEATAELRVAPAWRSFQERRSGSLDAGTAPAWRSFQEPRSGDFAAATSFLGGYGGDLAAGSFLGDALPSVAARLTADADQASPSRSIAWLRCLAVTFGFGQGCCLNIYLSAAGYYGEFFQDNEIFVWMCACVFLPPMVIFPLAKRWNPYFDRRFGARAVFPVRLVGVLLVAAALVAGLCLAATCAECARALGRQRLLVLALGACIGISSGSLANSSTQFFGALSPALTSWFFLGQTASGVYLNAAAKVYYFVPGCPGSTVASYFAGGVSVALVPCALYLCCQRVGILDSAYERHAELLEQRSCRASAQRCSGGPPEPGGGSPGFALAARACQLAAVAQNMSLTPLAGRLSHEDHYLGQRIVLGKLASDFLGRVAFYAVPRPKSLRLHAALNVALQLCRVPCWCLLVREILRPDPGLSEVALFAVWVPFVSTGALGGSWSTVVALESVPAARKSDMAGKMTLSVYLGFLSGLVFAAAVSYATDPRPR